MKKFSFPLEKLKAFRQTQLDQKLSVLESLHAEMRSLDLRRMRVALEERQAIDRVRGLHVIPVQELIVLEDFRRWTEKELLRLHEAGEDLKQKIERQREAVLETRKDVEALNTLRTHRLQTWHSEVDKEMEAAVAELVVARWGREEK